MNTSPRTFYQVLRLYQLVTERLSQTLAPMGLTPNQYTVLSMVRAMAPVTSAALARRIGVTAQSAGETVKALTDLGLLNREGTPEHKRLILLTLSSAGKRLLTRADKAVVRSEQQLFACLDAKTFAGFEQSIQTVRKSVSKERAPPLRDGSDRTDEQCLQAEAANPYHR